MMGPVRWELAIHCTRPVRVCILFYKCDVSTRRNPLPWIRLGVQWEWLQSQPRPPRFRWPKFEAQRPSFPALLPPKCVMSIKCV